MFYDLHYILVKFNRRYPVSVLFSFSHEHAHTHTYRFKKTKHAGTQVMCIIYHHFLLSFIICLLIN